jgi:hypothetical protein
VLSGSTLRCMSMDGGFHAVRAADENLQIRTLLFINTKTARKWHIDCTESHDSPAL